MIAFGIALAQVPAVLTGEWVVTGVVENGEVVPFAERMRRLALAGSDDCVVEHRVFDFGAAPEGAAAHRPARVVVSDEIRCRKGGLGDFLAIPALDLDVVWTDGDPLQLAVPGGAVTVSMTRIQKPRDVGVPAQWVSPTIAWVLDPVTYTIKADKVYGKKLPPLRMSDGQTTYVVEAREAPAPR